MLFARTLAHCAVSVYCYTHGDHHRNHHPRVCLGRGMSDTRLDPRPGRSFCAAVTGDCLAPAGLRVGSGSDALGGVSRADLYTCAYCGEPVCHNCSTGFGAHLRACDSHDVEELSWWLESACCGQ